MEQGAKETWASGEAYEKWVGRWSRPVAAQFIDWLDVPEHSRWADVGCGTGALSTIILASRRPAAVCGIDRSAGFIAVARETEPRASFGVGDATALPWDDASFDTAVSGLVLNFVPDHEAMAREMKRVTKPGGTVAAYVWDYAGGMQMMRHFWDVAVQLNPADSQSDQGERFPICEPNALAALFRQMGLKDVSARAIDTRMVFRDFDDYWTPFLGRQGAAPTYLAGLDEPTRDRIREALRERLRPEADGTIVMGAKAWAVKGTV